MDGEKSPLGSSKENNTYSRTQGLPERTFSKGAVLAVLRATKVNIIDSKATIRDTSEETYNAEYGDAVIQSLREAVETLSKQFSGIMLSEIDMSIDMGLLLSDRKHISNLSIEEAESLERFSQWFRVTSSVIESIHNSLPADAQSYLSSNFGEHYPQKVGFCVAHICLFSHIARIHSFDESNTIAITNHLFQSLLSSDLQAYSKMFAEAHTSTNTPYVLIAQNQLNFIIQTLIYLQQTKHTFRNPEEQE